MRKDMETKYRNHDILYSIVEANNGYSIYGKIFIHLPMETFIQEFSFDKIFNTIEEASVYFEETSKQWIDKNYPM